MGIGVLCIMRACFVMVIPSVCGLMLFLLNRCTDCHQSWRCRRRSASERSERVQSDSGMQWRSTIALVGPQYKLPQWRLRCCHGTVGSLCRRPFQLLQPLFLTFGIAYDVTRKQHSLYMILCARVRRLCACWRAKWFPFCSGFTNTTLFIRMSNPTIFAWVRAPRAPPYEQTDTYNSLLIIFVY